MKEKSKKKESEMAGESWYAVFKESTGELVSTGTEIASKEDLQVKGLKAIVIAKRPDETVVWDKTAKDFAPAPTKPQPVVADLVLEQQELAGLSENQKLKVRAAVARVVGEN